MELKHIAIIPDGNRRWARERKISIIFGYLKGVEKFYEICEWLLKNTEIEEITFYILSYENFTRRSREELEIILNILDGELRKIINRESNIYEILKDTETRVNFVGLINLLPEKIKKNIEKIIELTKNYKKRLLNLLICYSGRQEIINAIKRIKDFENIDEEKFRDFLWIKNDVDLIIRTGGFNRLSNLLLYQSAYSEIITLNKYWPDVTIDDIKNAINTYYNIKRNFGR